MTMLSFTDQELQGLIQLIDASLKAQGLQALNAAGMMQQKIVDAIALKNTAVETKVD